MSAGASEVVRAALQAYVNKDREAIEALIAKDYHFSSPLDNAIDRETYFRICWPNSETTEDFDIIHLVDDGEHVFVVYELRASGRSFRNCEVHLVRGGQLVDSQVYFGWDLPHRVSAGEHADAA